MSVPGSRRRTNRLSGSASLSLEKVCSWSLSEGSCLAGCVRLDRDTLGVLSCRVVACVCAMGFGLRRGACVLEGRRWEEDGA
eukprot:3158423-Rhodomonas_salina.1